MGEALFSLDLTERFQAVAMSGRELRWCGRSKNSLNTREVWPYFAYKYEYSPSVRVRNNGGQSMSNWRMSLARTLVECRPKTPKSHGAGGASMPRRAREQGSRKTHSHHQASSTSPTNEAFSLLIASKGVTSLDSREEGRARGLQRLECCLARTRLVTRGPGLGNWHRWMGSRRVKSKAIPAPAAPPSPQMDETRHSGFRNDGFRSPGRRHQPARQSHPRLSVAASSPSQASPCGAIRSAPCWGAARKRARGQRARGRVQAGPVNLRWYAHDPPCTRTG